MKMPVILLGDHKIIGPFNAGTVVFHNRGWVMLRASKIHKKMPEPHGVFDCRTKGKVLSLHHSGGSDCPLMKPGSPNNRGIPKN